MFLKKRVIFFIEIFSPTLSGISALQASKKFGIPSRTLYDRCKKMGITMGRQVPNKAKPYNLPNYPAQFPGLGGVSFQFLIEFLQS